MQTEIEEFLLHLAAERGLSENYQLSTRLSLEAFSKWAAKSAQINGVREVSRDLLTGFLGQRKREGFATASIKIVVVALKIFFRWLVQNGRVVSDPAELLPLPRVEKILPETLNELQVGNLLDVLPVRGPMALRNRAIFEVLYACGIRVSELCGIRVEDLDLQTRILRVTGKGDKTRVVPVGGRAHEAVAGYLSGERPDLVRKWTRSHLFLSVRGRALTPDRIWQLAKGAARAAGLRENVYPHLFRHSFATHLLGNGADLRVIQELLGHADIGTTQIYTHVDQQRLKSVHYRFHPRARRAGGGGGADAPGTAGG